MRNVFVTGAYGLLGGWLCKALLDAGTSVVVLKRDEVPISGLQLEGTEARCAVVHGDVTDAELAKRRAAWTPASGPWHHSGRSPARS